MPAIKSTAITYAEYNEISKDLVITFTQGHSYTYYGVPRDVYERFLKSASKGTYFNNSIRDQYAVRK